MNLPGVFPSLGARVTVQARVAANMESSLGRKTVSVLAALSGFCEMWSVRRPGDCPRLGANLPHLDGLM